MWLEGKKREMCTGFWSRNPLGKAHLGNREEDGRMNIKMNVKERCLRVGDDWNCSRIVVVLFMLHSAARPRILGQTCSLWRLNLVLSCTLPVRLGMKIEAVRVLTLWLALVSCPE